MTTVFIVNTDPDFISGFISLTDWNKFGYVIIGSCTNGTEALAFIMRRSPDLVFLEQNLPGMKALKIIENTQLHGIAAEFVLTEDSGSFDLAQQAMRIGVHEYLVKPVKKSEINRILRRFKDVYQSRLTKDMNVSLFSTRRLLRNSFMQNFISAEEPGEYSIEELNKYYHFTFSQGFFRIAVLQLRNLPREDEETFLPTLVEELRLRFDPICFEMIPYIQGALRLALVFNYDESFDAVKQLTYIRDLIRDMLKKRNCTFVSYTLGIGSESRNVTDLLDLLHTAERAAYVGILRGENKVYYFDQLKFDSVTSESIITPEFLNDLEIYAESMNFTKYDSLLRKALSRLTPFSDPEVIVDICRAAIMQTAKSSGVSDYTAREEIRKVLYSAMNSPSLSFVVEALVNNAKKRLKTAQKEREFSRPVREAAKYIKMNFAKNITLNDVADHVHLNASYLSMLFKKETGQNYMNFLTDCRIIEAKRLLRDSSLSVAEICYSVGFTDRKHFSKLFIKKVGIRPTAYRTLY